MTKKNYADAITNHTFQ